MYTRLWLDDVTEDNGCRVALSDNVKRSRITDNALKELKKAHNADTEKKRALTIPEQNLFEDFLLHFITQA